MIFSDIVGKVLNSHWKGGLLVPVFIPYLSKAFLHLFVTGKTRTAGMTQLLGPAQWEAW